MNANVYSGVIRLWERIGLAAGSIPVRLTDARQWVRARCASTWRSIRSARPGTTAASNATAVSNDTARETRHRPSPSLRIAGLTRSEWMQKHRPRRRRPRQRESDAFPKHEHGMWLRWAAPSAIRTPG